MPKPSDIAYLKRALIARIVSENRGTNPRVFGSALRHTDSQDSDLDLLVDPLPGASLFDLGAMQFELERSLGIPVDVLTPGDLPPHFRDKVVKEAKSL